MQVAVNKQINVAQTVDVVLELVDVHGGEFNGINVATSINMLAKLSGLPAKHAKSPAQVGVMLGEDRRFSRLIELVSVHCGKLDARGVANVLNGLAVLQADLDVKAVDEKLAKQLVNTLSQEIGVMNAQDAANTLNALSRLDAVASAMSPAGWDAVAKAVERTATLLAGWDIVANAQGIANTLNSLCALDVISDATSPTGWDAVAEAVERTATLPAGKDAVAGAA